MSIFLAKRSYRQLRHDIVFGALSPGDRLTEMKLAADFELSRATIRTALQQLATEGLIVQMPYTGWAVVSLTAHSAWELYTLRSPLEGLPRVWPTRS